ncbi:hypothetical protein Acr_06g0009360 [Actinidia rufa]|uniref:GDSL-like Lipase/Acylhydrolase superfamily protein n=1 Tax=Actinidia rufa TaxID=165716 RepID=A0A7J0ES03_9ERIC|nr:hypothetical protein Acr_06g0009360 [Actinidia rufa]
MCHFDQIYQLGDSISDSGNLIRETPIGAATPFTKLPYGEIFFSKSTGSCSNGVLMIDYFALAAGLPFHNPYKNNDANFRQWCKFCRCRLHCFTGGGSSRKEHFNHDCVEKLKNSLFMVGEIGGNDYNYALFQGKNMEEDLMLDLLRKHAVKLEGTTISVSPGCVEHQGLNLSEP